MIFGDVVVSAATTGSSRRAANIRLRTMITHRHRVGFWLLCSLFGHGTLVCSWRVKSDDGKTHGAQQDSKQAGVGREIEIAAKSSDVHCNM